MAIRHEDLTDEIRELTALHALGGLDAPAAQTFELHLEGGCPVCARELKAFRSVAQDLAFAPPPAVPPEALRARLIRRIETESAGTSAPDPQVWKRWGGSSSAASLVTIRASEDDWEETGIQGVSVRRLSVDPGRDAVTMMIRMSSGSSYPRHRHGGVEECFVLEGDLLVGDRVLHAGDYQRAASDSVHEVQSTEGGCLLLILSSMRDELLA